MSRRYTSEYGEAVKTLPQCFSSSPSRLRRRSSGMGVVPLVAHHDLVADTQHHVQPRLAGGVQGGGDDVDHDLGIGRARRGGGDGVPVGRRQSRLVRVRIGVAGAVVADVDRVAAEIAHPAEIGHHLRARLPPARAVRPADPVLEGSAACCAWPGRDEPPAWASTSLHPAAAAGAGAPGREKLTGLSRQHGRQALAATPRPLRARQPGESAGDGVSSDDAWRPKPQASSARAATVNVGRVDRSARHTCAQVHPPIDSPHTRRTTECSTATRPGPSARP